MIELMLRQIDYWLLQAKFYMGRGEGFDHLVEDAFMRAHTTMVECERAIEADKHKMAGPR